MSIVLPSGKTSFIPRSVWATTATAFVCGFRHSRALEAPVGQLSAREYVLTAQGQRYEVTAGPDGAA